MLFVLSLNAFAQELSILGKVIDADKNPIELANIILLEGEEKVCQKNMKSCVWIGVKYPKSGYQ